MPLVGHFVGGMDFADLKYVLSAAEMGPDGTEVKPENAVRYRARINTIINLITVGSVLFMIVKAYNKTKNRQLKKVRQELPRKNYWAK